MGTGLGGVVERDTILFNGGPPLRLEEWLRVCRPHEVRVLRRALRIAIVGWVPLLVLAALQPHLMPVAGLKDFVSDLAVHCRSLIAAPLFVLAESFCAPRLGAMAQHFVNSGFIQGHDLERFEAARVSTRRLRDSWLAEALVLAMAYALVGLLFYTDVQMPDWHQHTGGPLQPFSPAGWWHVLVSLPLLLLQMLGWLWRVFLWGRFLWLMSRLDLKLFPAHPDLAAGLKFVSQSIRSFAPVGLAFGVVVAGTVANGVVVRNHSLLDYRFAPLGLALFVVLLFCTPVIVFQGKLRRARIDGVLAYGTMAAQLGREFERKCLRDERISATSLEASDISQVADLNQTAGNVYGMRLIPIDVRSIIPLVTSTLLPLVPVILFSLPLDLLVSTIAKLLL